MTWSKRKAKQARRRAAIKATNAERRRNNASRVTGKALWSERYGRPLNIEERRARRSAQQKRRR